MERSKQQLAGNWAARFLLVSIAATMLTGCQSASVNPSLPVGDPAIMRRVMARKDEIVTLSHGEIQPDKPVLLLLHGATDDPREMMKIFDEWKGRYNVCLYSYNYHQRLEKVASDLVRQIKTLRKEIEAVHSKNSPVEDMTVITYSYSAIVFRMAVIEANDPALFANVSLVQLVPTAGGSSLARAMWLPGADALVWFASKPSVAVNPYGYVARELWEGEGNRKFYEAIDPDRTVSLLLEGDTHSLADAHSRKLQAHYQNGIGPNVIMIPKDAGVTHEYFPLEQAGLAYLKTALDWSQNKAAMSASRSGDASRFGKSGEVVVRSASWPAPGL